MVLLVVWLETVLRISSVLVFPALAVWAWRAGGSRRLWRVAGFGTLLVLLVGVFVATPAGGNMIVHSRGYAYTVSGSLTLHVLTMVLPMMAASLAVRGLAGRWSSRLALYATSLLAAGVAWIAGVLAAVWIINLVFQ